MCKISLAIMMLISLLTSGCVPTIHNVKEAFEKKDYGNAITYLKATIEQSPQDGDAYKWLCGAYVGNKQYDEAITSCNKALQLPHNAKNEFEIWNLLAVAQFHTGNLDASISSMNKRLELEPGDTDSYYYMAQAYINNKQYDEAITAARRAIELKHDNAEAYFELGRAYLMKEKYAEAINALKKSIELKPSQPDPYRGLVLAFVKKGNYDESLQVLNNGIKQGVDLKPELALIYCLMGRYDDSIATATEMIERETIQGGLGIGIRIIDNSLVVQEVDKNSPAFKAGIRPGNRIVEIDGDEIDGWSVDKVAQKLQGAQGTQVVLSVRGKDTDTKIAVTREKIINKEAAESLSTRSYAYRQKGSLALAAHDAKAAMDADPSLDNARMALGATYLDQGQYDEALQLLSKVKDAPLARLLEATTYVKQGKTKESVAIYLSIPEEELAPENVPLMKDRMALLQSYKPIVKAHRDKAKTFAAKNMHKETLSELSEALKMADDSDAQVIQEEMLNLVKQYPLLGELPEEARKHALRAEVLVNEGNFSQAIKEFKKAIRIAPYAAKLYYNCAIVCAEVKNYPEAVRHMNTYLKVAADAPDARDAKDKIITWEFMMEKGQ